MLQYITRRLLQFIPVFFGVTLVLFFITTILPGDPIKMRAGERSMSPAVYEQLRAEYGFDQPWYVQYVTYLQNLAQGDLGTSITTGRPVKDIIADSYPYTVKLAFAAIVIEIIAGVGVGIVAAVKRYSIWDVSTTLVTSILVALPVFWLGIMLQYTFGIWLKNATNSRVLPARFRRFRWRFPGLGPLDSSRYHLGRCLNRVRCAHHAQPTA